jgi:hypothetical protein
VQYRVGNDWYAWDRRGASPGRCAAGGGEGSGAAPAPDALRDMQLRLSATLARQKSDREALRAEEARLRAADPNRAARTVYIGDAVQIDGTMLSPDGRWLLVVTSQKGSDRGRVGKLPVYVTESATRSSRRSARASGRNLPNGEGLVLVDLADNSVHELSLDALPGIATDPLASLRAAQKLDPLKGNRAVRVLPEGDNSGGDTITGATTARAWRCSCARSTQGTAGSPRWIRRRGPVQRPSPERSGLDQLELQ